VFSVAAWFPGGATVSQPYLDADPTPRRTGRGELHHPAPSLRPPHRHGRQVVDDTWFG
jgi:hypothetical protein